MFKVLKDLLLNALADKKAKLTRPEVSNDQKSVVLKLADRESKESSVSLRAREKNGTLDKQVMAQRSGRPATFAAKIFQGHCCEWHIKPGELRINPLLDTSVHAQPTRNFLESTKTNIFQSRKDETELIMGIDFGTSSTKVVIRDVNLGRAMAVSYSGNEKGKHISTILPSRVFLQEDIYSLTEGICINDLKLRLIDASEEKRQTAALMDAIAYVALVIRHARAWLFREMKDRYLATDIIWKINFGLPARNYEDEALVDTFKILALSAANLSSDEACVSITKEDVLKHLTLARQVLSGKSADEGVFRLEDVDVVPEIAAQIYGFVRSDQWDKHGNSMMMMVDVGAGTVDSAFFSIVYDRDLGQNRYSFFGVDVKPYGVMNLHRERVDWITKEIQTLKQVEPEIQTQLARISDILKQQRNSTDQMDAIPEAVEGYIEPVRFREKLPSHFIDTTFRKKNLSTQINRCAHSAFTHKVPRNQLQGVPIFFCGGGSRMEYYSSLCEDLTAQNTVWSFRSKSLPKPPDLKADISNQDYDRLSVAYGLSWHLAAGRPLGEFIRSLDIPSNNSEPDTTARLPNEISKDMV